MMTSTPPSEPVTRMELPRPDEDNIAGVVSSVVIAFFVAVAFFNLANYRILPMYANVLSACWLLIVATGLFLFVSDVYAHGIRQSAVNRIAPLSPYHFVETLRQSGDDQIVRFSFTLFKRQFIQLQISESEIASIGWSSGQGTSLAGRDMDDWTVTVWYHQKGSKRWTATGDREESLYTVGPSGPRSETAAAGHALMAFLESAGIVFYPSSNECEFTTHIPKTAR